MQYIQDYQHKGHQTGAVSLFVVIFTALLITTITISFMQLMVKDQRQAMYSDLSESAYDSATAGVEDAKRLLLMQQDCIGSTSDECAAITAAIASNECTTLSTIFGGSESGEASIIQTEGDRKLEQAYTCVKIKQNTSDYLGSIEANTVATLVPLRGVDAFDTVVVSWALSRNGADTTLPTSTDAQLPVNTTTNWPESHPSVLRTQLINGGGGFSLTDFDGDRSKTVFLYPARVGLDTFPIGGSEDIAGRRSTSATPQRVACRMNAASGGYACKAALTIGSMIPGGSTTTFLNLMAFYNATDYKVELKQGGIDGSIVDFANVQPEVDSTGRANDLFRRVVSRVQLNNTFHYPVAALESRNSICKNFSVTTDPGDYTNRCNPTD